MAVVAVAVVAVTAVAVAAVAVAVVVVVSVAWAPAVDGVITAVVHVVGVHATAVVDVVVVPDGIQNLEHFEISTFKKLFLKIFRIDLLLFALVYDVILLMLSLLLFFIVVKRLFFFFGLFKATSLVMISGAHDVVATIVLAFCALHCTS